MNSNISNKHNIIIRKGNEADLPEMLQLFAATIDAVCRKDYTPQQLEAWKSGAENEERWRKVIRDQYVVIALNENKIAGFCTLDQGNYIDLLFVHKDEQQKGIASILYQEVENEALRQHKKQLTAEVSKTARPFFKTIGFQVVQEQEVYVKGVTLTNYKMIKSLF
ncbi:putative acyltransferase [Chryseobacterium gleum]|uniref:Acetyltransferase, GNAT family n=2 Tax=Chryseobacterium gleum TaxID=250 RepID=A0ABP2IK81_CHRGE|nr:GNAT family N-acetyltransferase [Chryseobacterium gleum]EFK32989.1 acetyltransferase, GNAT family [Chryseobacterium gleum ATCC 35910]QQY33821.1 GNAT family N-acetyltransferase [Chryseobacterium gleum]VEE07929.1 putative acyltransferase [Chryseobacterium gleum]